MKTVKESIMYEQNAMFNTFSFRVNEYFIFLRFKIATNNSKIIFWGRKGHIGGNQIIERIIYEIILLKINSVHLPVWIF